MVSNQPGKKHPECQEMRLDAMKRRIQCCRPGVPVLIIGTFGERHAIACLPCIRVLKDRGWKVVNQLGGGDPEQAQQTLP